MSITKISGEITVYGWALSNGSADSPTPQASRTQKSDRIAGSKKDVCVTGSVTTAGYAQRNKQSILERGIPCENTN